MGVAQENIILTVEAIREVEKRHQNDQPTLMSQAGLAIAARAKKLCPDTNAPILVVVGPGNNGGDAIIAAAHLTDWGYCPTILMDRSVDSLLPEVKIAFDRWKRLGNALVKDYPSAPAALIIDGLFGVGLDRPIEGIYQFWVSQMNRAAKTSTILAIDIPSGLNADNGNVMGCCVYASETLTCIALKPGLLTCDGPDHCGEILVDTLKVDLSTLSTEAGKINDPKTIQGRLKPRPLNTHKGNFGTVGLIGGTDGMTGAIILAGRAALKMGGGKVIVGTLAKNAVLLDPLNPELMIRSSHRLIELVSESAIAGFNVLVLGPGMGDLVYTGTPIIRNALTHDLPIVLDADALNLISVDKYLQKMLEDRQGATILTPHPGEAARLLDITTQEVQQNRIGTAKTLASQFNAYVILKGCGTIICTPEGKWLINRTGNPGMATAGMGDVLTGMIAALVAQDLHILDACAIAVCLHGAAADACVQSGMGPIGLTASDVIDQARSLLNRLV